MRPGKLFRGSPATIEVIEGLVLKISEHSRQEEVVPCEAAAKGIKPVAVLADKTVAPRLPNSGIPILIDESFRIWLIMALAALLLTWKAESQRISLTFPPFKLVRMVCPSISIRHCLFVVGL